MKTAELDQVYNRYMEAIQLGIWGEMYCEKILYETATYSKIEFLRMKERVLTFQEIKWKRGSVNYPFPKSNLLSVE